MSPWDSPIHSNGWFILMNESLESFNQPIHSNGWFILMSESLNHLINRFIQNGLIHINEWNHWIINQPIHSKRLIHINEWLTESFNQPIHINEWITESFNQLIHSNGWFILRSESLNHLINRFKRLLLGRIVYPTTGAADTVLLHHHWIHLLHIIKCLVSSATKSDPQKTTEGSPHCRTNHWYNPPHSPRTVLIQSEQKGC